MEKTHWRKEGVKITNGKRTHLVGEVVNYSKEEKDYTGKWVITGVTKMGQIVIEAYTRLSDNLPNNSIIHLDDDSDLTPTCDF